MTGRPGGARLDRSVRELREDRIRTINIIVEELQTQIEILDARKMTLEDEKARHVRLLAAAPAPGGTREGGPRGDFR